MILDLVRLWESPEMIESRQLVSSYHGTGGVDLLARDINKAIADRSSEFHVFTRHLNFWEQVGLAYGHDSDSLALIGFALSPP